MLGGLGRLKEELQQYIEWPLKNPELFEAIGIKPTKGILLYGSPGTGKTTIAKILACQADAYFISASPADITSMWYGQEEKRVRAMFQLAREKNPAIIHVDDIDGLFPKSRELMHEATHRALVQFINEMDGLRDTGGVVVLGSTNRGLDSLDQALLREGRFDRKFHVPLPDFRGRIEIFKIHTGNMPISEDVNFEKLARETKNFSGAKIKTCCELAGYNAIRRYCNEKNVKVEDIRFDLIKEIKVCNKDFQKAVISLVK